MATGLAPTEESVVLDPCKGVQGCGVQPTRVTVTAPGAEVPEGCTVVCLPVLSGQERAGVTVEPDQAQAQAAGASSPVAIPATWVIVGGITIGSLAALAPFARTLLFLFLAPFATRLERARLLEDPTRQRIVNIVREKPGISLRVLAGEVGVAWGTILHHVHKLERGGFLVTERVGRYRRFYVNGSGYRHEERVRNGVLLAPGTAEVARTIRENPGLSQRELSRRLELSPSTVLWHVRRLREVGAVEMEREGRVVRYRTLPVATAPAATA